MERVLLGLNREVRFDAGADAGGGVDVTVELDVAPREIEVPEGAREHMAFTLRKEYAHWVMELTSKRLSVRQAIEMTRPGRPEPDRAGRRFLRLVTVTLCG